jgi:predicted heme/steroid binding protein
MENTDFETLADLAEYDSADSCYVAYDTMVFDVTSTLNEMEDVSVDDCGTDLTPKLTQEQGDVFYNLNIDNYVGSVLSQLPTEDDMPVDDMFEDDVSGEDEAQIQIQEFETQEAETMVPVSDTSGYDPMTLGILGILLVAMIILIAVLISSIKKGKKKEEVTPVQPQQEEIRVEEIKQDEEEGK